MQIARNELVKTLELVKLAVATSNAVPIFQCFIFKDGAVTAYDDNIAIIGPAMLKGAKHGFGLQAQTLLGLLSCGVVDDILFDTIRDCIHLTMGKSLSKLPFQPQENFIFFTPDADWTHTIPITESLVVALKMALETVSTDTTQPALLGITLTGKYLYSCNGDALTRVAIEKGI